MPEYIPPDQLLVKFGGNDTWEFDYAVEKERLHNLALSAFNKKKEKETNDDLFQDDILEEEEGESIQSQQAEEERGRQVRFSAGLPPTRQSRFGHDDDILEARSTSPEQQLLQKGSATSRGFRRRQVSRLMSLQESKDRRSGTGIQRAVTLMEDEGEEPGAMNGTPPSIRRHSADPSLSGSVATLGSVMLRFVFVCMCVCVCVWVGVEWTVFPLEVYFSVIVVEIVFQILRSYGLCYALTNFTAQPQS